MSPEAKLLVYGLVALLAFSEELNFQKKKAASNEALIQFNKSSTLKPLPKTFQMKITTVVNASPAEVANALSDAMLRPLWEPRLSEVKQEGKSTISTRYVGYTMGYQRYYNFEILPSEM